MPIVDNARGVFGSKRVDPSSKTPYSDATRCRKKGKTTAATHVRRPMNAFMVYSQLERNRILEINPNLHNAEISKNLGKTWKLLPDAQKKQFMDEAKRLKELHQLEFPEYKYRPKRRGRPGKGSVAKRRFSTSDEESPMLKTEFKLEVAHLYLGEDMKDTKPLSEANSCSNVLTADSLDRTSYYSNEQSETPRIRCSSWTSDSEVKTRGSPNEAEGIVTGSTNSNSCLELLPEDILYLLSAPTVVGSSENISHSSSFNNRNLLTKSEIDENNNSFFFAGHRPENSSGEDLPNIEAFRDFGDVAELNELRFSLDLHSSNILEDFLMDFAWTDKSMASCPRDCTTVLSEMPDPDDLAELNPDLLLEFSEFAAGISRGELKLLF